MTEIANSLIDDMVCFYKSGIKDHQQKLGVELEYTLVKTGGDQVKYFDEYGQKWLMEQMSDEYPTPITDEAGHLIGVKNDRDSITLEPAGQFELSAGPFEKISDVKETFGHLIDVINGHITPHNITLNALGYHPAKKASELEIIPKVRYGLMNEYFAKNSPLGIRMMRGTGSTQVSIDYKSEADCVRKLRLSYLISPVLALITDNTAVFEGEKRTSHIMRTEVWEDCDPRRCGIVPGVLDAGFSLADYAKYVLSTQAMFEMNGESGELTEKTIAQIFEGKKMSETDCANASSHLFNDVRLKNFIEIRPADALPLEHAVAYVALIKGLFYSEESLCQLEDFFGKVEESQYDVAKTNLKKDGFNADVYGKSAGEVADKMIELARLGLDDDEKDYLQPLAKIVEERKTLADRQAPLK